jgi:hypothetical protein
MYVLDYLSVFVKPISQLAPSMGSRAISKAEPLFAKAGSFCNGENKISGIESSQTNLKMGKKGNPRKRVISLVIALHANMDRNEIQIAGANRSSKSKFPYTINVDCSGTETLKNTTKNKKSYQNPNGTTS